MAVDGFRQHVYLNIDTFRKRFPARFGRKPLFGCYVKVATSAREQDLLDDEVTGTAVGGISQEKEMPVA